MEVLLRRPQQTRENVGASRASLQDSWPGLVFSQLLFLIVQVLVLQNVLAQTAEDEYLKRVSLGEGRNRFYLPIDHDGLPHPENWNELIENVRAGDELALRYYPMQLFGFEWVDDEALPGKHDSNGCVMILPSGLENDTFTVEPGWGSMTFATTEVGQFAVRLVSQQLDTVGTELRIDQIRSSIATRSTHPVSGLNEELIERGVSSTWKIYRADFNYPIGVWVIEILHLGGSMARVIAVTENPVEVLPASRQVAMTVTADGGSEDVIAIRRTSTSAFYEGISPMMAPGVHRVNILRTFSAGAWESRQAGTLDQPQKLATSDLVVVVKRYNQLPGALRTRVGYAAFDRAREGRLIANFAMILDPERYFTKRLGVLSLRRLSPTTGLQIGGTGEKDVVFLIGISYKLIEQSDLVVGCRFGKDNDLPWKFSRNAYFGVTLDPGLFERLSKER